MKLKSFINGRGQLVRQNTLGQVFTHIGEVIVQEAKDKPCTDCGKIYHHSVMDFDHLPQFQKLFPISKWRQHSRKQIKEEIAKCEVVCSNCHRARTWSRSHD